MTAAGVVRRGVASPATRLRTTPRGMIVAQVLVVLSLIPWLLLAMVAPMAMDSGDERWAWTFILTVWSYGPLAILCLVAGWVFQRQRRERAAVIASLLPLTLVAALLLASFLGL